MRNAVRVLIGCAIGLTLHMTSENASAQAGKGQTYDGKTIAERTEILESDSSQAVGDGGRAGLGLGRATRGAALPAAKALIKAVGDRDEVVRFYSIRALGEIGTSAREAVPELVKVLRGPHAIMS